MTETSSDARRYAVIRYRLLLVDTAVSWAFLAAFQFSGASAALAGWWAQRSGSEPLVVLGYAAVFGALAYLAGFPTHLYGSYVLEHRFGLSRMTPASWVGREIKHLAVGGVLSALLLEGLYLLLRIAPTQWPFYATVGWIIISVVLVRVFPTILLPLFYKTTPVEDQELVNRLLTLCGKVRLEALGVFRFNLGAETRKANAALAGLGKTRRVLLSDTLIQEFTPEEIEGVLAHELAHYRFHHIAKLLVISAVGSWIAFAVTDAAARKWVEALGLSGLADIAGLPMLLLWLSLLGVIGLPMQNALSRRFEWQADRFAIATTLPRAFAEALTRLAKLNLADPSPPWWVVWMFYDHPPISERIQAAERA